MEEKATYKTCSAGIVDVIGVGAGDANGIYLILGVSNRGAGMAAGVKDSSIEVRGKRCSLPFNPCSWEDS